MNLDNITENTSLCVVWNDSYNNIWLSRLADLSNGQLELPLIDEYLPKYCDNRNRIHWENGPSDDCSIGIWRWVARSQKADAETKHIVSNFEPSLRPARFVLVKNANSIEQLKTKLLHGISAHKYNCDTIFSYEYCKGNYIGLLCNQNELDFSESITLKSDISALPIYKFTEADILNIKPRMRFIKTVPMPPPAGVLHLNSVGINQAPGFIDSLHSVSEKSEAPDQITPSDNAQDILLSKANAVFSQNQYSQALTLYRIWLTNGGMSQQVISNTLSCMKKLSQWDEYLKLLEYAFFHFDLGKKKTEKYCRQLYLLYYENNDDEKISHLLRCVPLAKHICQMSPNTVSALLSLNRIEGAEKVLSSLWSLGLISEEEYSDYCLKILSRRECSEKDFDEARKLIANLIDKPKFSQTCVNNYIKICINLRKYEEALQLLDALNKVRPTYQNVRSELSVLISANRLDDAKSRYASVRPMLARKSNAHSNSSGRQYFSREMETFDALLGIDSNKASSLSANSDLNHSPVLSEIKAIPAASLVPCSEQNVVASNDSIVKFPLFSHENISSSHILNSPLRTFLRFGFVNSSASLDMQCFLGGALMLLEEKFNVLFGAHDFYVEDYSSFQNFFPVYGIFEFNETEIDLVCDLLLQLYRSIIFHKGVSKSVKISKALRAPLNTATKIGNQNYIPFERGTDELTVFGACVFFSFFMCKDERTAFWFNLLNHDLSIYNICERTLLKQIPMAVTGLSPDWPYAHAEKAFAFYYYSRLFLKPLFELEGNICHSGCGKSSAFNILVSHRFSYSSELVTTLQDWHEEVFSLSYPGLSADGIDAISWNGFLSPILNCIRFASNEDKAIFTQLAQYVIDAVFSFKYYFVFCALDDISGGKHRTNFQTIINRVSYLSQYAVTDNDEQYFSRIGITPHMIPVDYSLVNAVKKQFGSNGNTWPSICCVLYSTDGSDCVVWANGQPLESGTVMVAGDVSDAKIELRSSDNKTALPWRLKWEISGKFANIKLFIP